VPIAGRATRKGKASELSSVRLETALARSGEWSTRCRTARIGMFVRRGSGSAIPDTEPLISNTSDTAIGATPERNSPCKGESRNNANPYASLRPARRPSVTCTTSPCATECQKSRLSTALRRSSQTDRPARVRSACPLDELSDERITLSSDASTLSGFRLDLSGARPNWQDRAHPMRLRRAWPTVAWRTPEAKG
jgi:hypothetical protein